jgi:hypothetical protein
MAHLDFSQIEYTLGTALHHIFIKTLVDGDPVNYARAIAFFGNEEGKPTPYDSVVEAMVEIQKDIEEIDQTLPAFLPAIAATPKMDLPPEVKIPPMIILRKRILWLIKRNVANIYNKIGSSKEEMTELKAKTDLTLEEIRRVQELLKNTHELTLKIKQKLGIETDEGLVDKEKKKHLTKRLNVRDSWLAL